MDPYWLFLKTLVNTVVSLMGAAAVLFTSGPVSSSEPSRRPLYLRAAYTGTAVGGAQASQMDRQDAVVDALVGALKDTDADVRKQAAIALGEIGNPRAVDGLITALADKQAEVRRVAAVALGEIGDARAIEPLTRALKDSDPGVRRCAVIAIAELSGHDRDVGRPRPTGA